MMKIIYALLLLCLSITDICAQLSGSWSGNLEVPGGKLIISFDISKEEGAWVAKLNSPDQHVFGIKADSVRFVSDRLYIAIKAAGIRYEGTYSEAGQEITGTFYQANLSLPLNLLKADSAKGSGADNARHRPQEPQAPFPYQIEEIVFYNKKENLKLAGTFTLPKGNKNPPIAVMISGSGQQDRNEEIFGHKPFWVIADNFAKKGIGVLRYDDRGTGASEKGDLKNATSENFAGDVAAAVDFLKSKGYTHIGLIGHSEGGMIAPMVASQRKDIAFIVLLAGPGISGDSILTIQTYTSGIAEGVPEAAAQFNRGFSRQITGFIKHYTGNSLWEDLGTLIDRLLNAPGDITAQLSPQQKKNIKEQAMATYTNKWIEYFIKYDPTPVLQKVKCPVLAINGTKDVQVPYKENLEGIKTALQKGGNANVKIIAAEGLNHLFQKAGTGSVSEYEQIEESFSEDIIHEMEKWITETVR